MQLVVNAKDMRSAAELCARIANSSTNAIAASLLTRVVATNECVCLVASNMSEHLSYPINAVSYSPGEFAVDAKLLAQIVSQNSGVMKFTLEGSNVKVEGCGRHKLTNTVGDFPSWGEITPTSRAEFSNGEINDLFGHVAYAVPSKDFRRALTGFNVSRGRVCGSDGKLAVISKSDLLGNINATFSSDFVGILTRIADKDVVIEHDDRRCCATFPRTGAVLYSQLIEGKYPDVSAVIPKRFSGMATILTGEMLNAIRRALPTTCDKNNAIVVKFETDRVTISAYSEIGTYEETIECVCSIDEPFSCGFNSTFIIATLKEIDSLEFDIRWAGAQSPMVISPNPDNGGEVTRVIMPLKLSELAEAATGNSEVAQ